jgi:hypothetical protein
MSAVLVKGENEQRAVDLECIGQVDSLQLPKLWMRRLSVANHVSRSSIFKPFLEDVS